MSRIFINNINTSIGLSLLSEYRGDADPSDGPEFITTLDPNSPIPRPKHIKKCLNVIITQRYKPRLFRKYLLDCETIIYDLHTSDLKEVEEKLNVIKEGPIEDPKTVILISSIAVWANSVQKERPPTPPPE
jgi:hypothetical protein